MASLHDSVLLKKLRIQKSRAIYTEKLESLVYRIFKFRLITGSDTMVKLLIENGANINVLNNFNNSALILAISEGIHGPVQSL